MKIDTAVRHVTPANGNIFLDLGFPPEEAALLKADADRDVAMMRIKGMLRDEVVVWMQANQLDEETVARKLHVARATVKRIVNGKLRRFSIDALVNMVIRTGKSVSVVAS